MISSKILFVNNIKSALADFFSSNNYSKIAILVDENTEKLCLPSTFNKNELNNFLILKIRSGEKNKNINSCIKIWDIRCSDILLASFAKCYRKCRRFSYLRLPNSLSF